MFVITNKDGIAICVSQTLEYLENGYPLVRNGAYAIASPIVGDVFADIAFIPEDYEDGEYLFDGQLWKARPETTEELLTDAVAALETLGFAEA